MITLSFFLFINSARFIFFGVGDPALIDSDNLVFRKIAAFVSAGSDTLDFFSGGDLANPPFFNSVLQSGARVPVTHIPSSDTKIGPVVILSVFSGPKRGHTIAVMPYDKVRSGRHVIADIYRWRGPSASFTLLCRAR